MNFLEKLISIEIKLSYLAVLSCGFFIIISAHFIFDLPILGMFLYISIFSLSFCFISSFSDKLNQKTTILNKRALPLYFFPLIFIVFTLSFYNPYVSKYFSFFPIADVDLNNNWFKDTVYNISIIQSILNFGYPSIGIDGHKLTAYHVLSHYIDAILFKISGLDPYASYGFTSYVKATFFNCAILLFCMQCFKRNLISYMAFFIVAPLIIGSWHAILSHALWVPSLILLFSARFTFEFLFNEKQAERGSYRSIFFISLLLCLGKISTGLTYITMVYSIAFLRDIRKPKMYISGLMLILFIFAYQKYINFSYGIASELDFSFLNLHSIMHHFINANIQYEIFFIPFIACIFAIYVYMNDFFSRRLLFGVIVSFSSIFLITQAFSSFNWSDKYYFYQGLYSSFILLMICYLFSLPCEQERDKKTHCKLTILSLLTMIVLSFYVYQPLLSLKEFTLKKAISQYHYIKDVKLHKIEQTKSGNLYSLTSFVKKHANRYNVSNRDLAIFIPKDIVTKELIDKDASGNKNFYTMNIYAASGVQIISGLIGNERAYGLINYKNDSLLRNDIDPQIECKRLKLKGIITVLSYKNNKYVYRSCE